MAAVARPLRPCDRPVALDIARSLRGWFNAEGLATLERDLAVHRGLVLEEEGRILGFATWKRIDESTADLSWMGVAPALHRQGLGTILLEALLADVRQAGLSAIKVSTVADSCDYEPYERTRGFYRARGFLDHGVDVGFYGPPEDRYDRLVLRRAIRD